MDLTLELLELARTHGLSKGVDEILEQKAKAIARVDEYRLTTYRDLFLGKPRISKVWRIDRLESAGATFGKVTDFTPSTIRKLIECGRIDARISIDRNEIIFAIEDLVSDGIMSIEEGDEIMKETREVITTEQLLYRKRKEELIEAYDSYVKIIEAKNISSDRKEMLIKPGRDILTMVSEAENAKLMSSRH